MTWLIALLAVLLIVGFALFGGVGGMTLIFMLVALGAGIALFRAFVRDRRSLP